MLPGAVINMHNALMQNVAFIPLNLGAFSRIHRTAALKMEDLKNLRLPEHQKPNQIGFTVFNRIPHAPLKPDTDERDPP